MKITIGIFLLGLCLVTGRLFCQVSDDFSDGDFSHNPAWTGDTAFFQVNSDFLLQTNGQAASDTIILSTPFSSPGQTEWRFYLRYDFSPSTSNFIRVYLLSDTSDLTGPVNGYFVQAGESGSNDSYDLYRQDGANITRIIDGTGGKAGSAIYAYVKVTRDSTGIWTLATDADGSGVLEVEGTAVDSTYASSSFMGIYVRHSSTRADAFFFDDFYAGNIIGDTISPWLLSANALSDTTVELTFSEAMDSLSVLAPGNYLIDKGIGNPKLVQQVPGNPEKILLLLGTPLQNQTTYTVSVSHLSDLAGNSLPPGTQAMFIYVLIESALQKDIVVNEIMADPVPPIGLPDREYLELFNRSGKALDLHDWTITNGTTIGTLPTYIFHPGEYVLLVKATDTALFSPFGKVLSPDVWPSLVNSGDNIGLRSDSGLLIDSVDYEINWFENANQRDGGYSLELISPDVSSCPPAKFWEGSTDIQGGTPGRLNSVFSAFPDTIPPEVQSVRIISPLSLELCFNESMDSMAVSATDRYFLDQGIGNPVSVNIVLPEVSCVVLTFNDSLKTGVIYFLTLDPVPDCSGNTGPEHQFVSVASGKKPQPFDLVFSEIFPDFSPQTGLPEAEFVEIYNRSAKTIELGGISLTDGTTTGFLSEGLLMPGEYLVLCDDDNSAEFAAFGKVMGLERLPSLNNANDSLYLLGDDSGVIDYLFYANDWYRDAVKAQGGWTLEKFDLDYIDCNQPDNWRASEAIAGGTPGLKNSVDGKYLDLISPEINSLIIIDTHTFEITFSEQMDPVQLENTAAYFAGELGEPILALASGPHFRSVTLIFGLELEVDRFYILTVNGLGDCSGNSLEGEIAFGIPVKPEPGDIKINEILFNPYPGGSDFVEIVNASEKVLDLRDVQIGEIFPGTDSVFNQKIISTESRLFLPGEILCLTADPEFQQSTYLPWPEAKFHSMNSFPGYDDHQGECVLITLSGEILDRFFYLDDYHFPTLSDDEGVSLERLSLQRSSSDRDNWHSAASTFRFATPGYANSQQVSSGQADAEVSLEYQTFTPNDDGDQDVLVINYDFDFPGANARITIFDAQGRLIRNFQLNALLSPQPGSFFWDGRDDKNQKADIGMYVVLFEVANQATGEKRAYKRVAVLGDRF